VGDSPNYDIYEDENRSGGLRPVIIVIDPGHGGRDSGAIGYSGTYEKRINLAVARILQKIINKIKGFRAILTRDGDYFIPLRRRLGIAHEKKLICLFLFMRMPILIIWRMAFQYLLYRKKGRRVKRLVG
jgi:N-acetylmuramoyl-L-alanine amidase